MEVWLGFNWIGTLLAKESAFLLGNCLFCSVIHMEQQLQNQPALEFVQRGKYTDGIWEDSFIPEIFTNHML